MKFYNIRRNSYKQVGIEGLLLIAAAVPIISLNTSIDQNSFFSNWRIATAIISSLIFLISAYFILRKPDTGKILAGIGATGSIVSAAPDLATDQASALAGAVIYILSIHGLLSFEIKKRLSRASDEVEKGLQRTRWASLSLIALSFVAFFIVRQPTPASELSLLIAAMVTQLLSIFWSIKQQSNFHKLFCIVLNTVTLMFAAYFMQRGTTWIGTTAIGVSVYLLLPRSLHEIESPGQWWEPLLNHPGRVTLVTFFLLCLFGTFLLVLPSAASKGAISLIDAAFTSVSAVCVTGLIVLDTPNDFSFIGQAFILLLIQLGGLGIMTVTTVALHALGRRISLKQERMLTSTMGSDQMSLVDSLLQIVKFTAVMEVVGAIILTILFYKAGINYADSIWKGIFTSISAFCNAGFALQSNSLIPFQNNPLIIHTVAILIICGGIAPSVTLIVPRWLSGKSVPVAARIALITTIALLLLGTFVFLAFEWSGSLSGLSIIDKFHNAWFQSVTLRTAGFNSVAIENVYGPTFLVMICMMFIGGSPGGTAGGVKTTTFGVLAITFWSCALGYDDISLQNRRIVPETVYKAVTTIASGVFVLLTVTLMLEVTQQISSRNLIFEAASALGTVGLSTGATGNLDSIGKIIIMFAMFAGRIGPVTLFTLLSREKSANAENFLDARINIT
jgi:trk system potassium uptake protein TrkH